MSKSKEVIVVDKKINAEFGRRGFRTEGFKIENIIEKIIKIIFGTRGDRKMEELDTSKDVKKVGV